MNLLKKYKVVFAIVLPVLILVLIRSLSINHFKSDAKRWAVPSVLASNIVTEDKIETLPGEKIIIKLDKELSGNYAVAYPELRISADSILERKNLKIIRNHSGPVLLYSSEDAISARVWMILSQMGFMNIYIITRDTDNEIRKNKFRPDTLVRPEL